MEAPPSDWWTTAEGCFPLSLNLLLQHRLSPALLITAEGTKITWPCFHKVPPFPPWPSPSPHAQEKCIRSRKKGSSRGSREQAERREAGRATRTAQLCRRSGTLAPLAWRSVPLANLNVAGEELAPDQQPHLGRNREALGERQGTSLLSHPTTLGHFVRPFFLPWKRPLSQACSSHTIYSRGREALVIYFPFPLFAVGR